jgi:hypothetical protein
MKATAADDTRTTALLERILAVLERIANSLDPPLPNCDRLFSEIARVTNHARFTINSLFERSEMDLLDDDDRLSRVLTEYCGMNAARLAKLFALVEGSQLKRIKKSAQGQVWQLRK